jgi:hypothetical protein
MAISSDLRVSNADAISFGLPPRQLLGFLSLWNAPSVGGTDEPTMTAQHDEIYINDEILITHLIVNEHASRLRSEFTVSQPDLLPL